MVLFPVQIKVTEPTDKEWKFYESGPHDKPLVVFLSSLVTTPDSYYKQMIHLAEHGIHAISVLPPSYDSHANWIIGFNAFLNCLKVQQCHIVAAGFGGFQAVLYARTHTQRVESLVLVNSYHDNNSFDFNDFQFVVPTLSVIFQYIFAIQLLPSYPFFRSLSFFAQIYYHVSREDQGQAPEPIYLHPRP